MTGNTGVQCASTVVSFQSQLRALSASYQEGSQAGPYIYYCMVAENGDRVGGNIGVFYSYWSTAPAQCHTHTHTHTHKHTFMPRNVSERRDLKELQAKPARRMAPTWAAPHPRASPRGEVVRGTRRKRPQSRQPSVARFGLPMSIYPPGPCENSGAEGGGGGQQVAGQSSASHCHPNHMHRT